MNPPIPTKPCFICGELTNETQSKKGIAHMFCFQNEFEITKRVLDGVQDYLLNGDQTIENPVGILG